MRDGGVERGLATLLTEARRVEEYGFTDSELERAKTNLLRGVDRWYEERDKQESRTFAGVVSGSPRRPSAGAPPSPDFPNRPGSAAAICSIEGDIPPKA